MIDNIDILLVEDNPADAELVIRALKNHNIHQRMHHVKDGEQALDFLFCRGKYSQRQEKSPVKVIFLDLKIPKVSGLEVLKEIKDNAQTRRIPVVVITSSAQDPDAQKAYELGANGYVVKPVGFEDFINAISSTGLFWLRVNEPPRS
ncbi:MAG: response regulator [Bacteroidales bacterium]